MSQIKFIVLVVIISAILAVLEVNVYVMIAFNVFMHIINSYVKIYRGLE